MVEKRRIPNNVYVEVVMTVIDFGTNKDISYRYRVNTSDRLLRLEEVRDWADNQNISCTIIPGLAFFHYEPDVTLFLLRWS